MIVGAKYWNRVADSLYIQFLQLTPGFPRRNWHLQPPVLHQAFLQNNYDAHYIQPPSTSPPPPPAQSPHQCIIHKQLITKAKPIASTLKERAVQRPQPHKRNVSLMTDYSTFFVS